MYVYKLEQSRTLYVNVCVQAGTEPYTLCECTNWNSNLMAVSTLAVSTRSTCHYVYSQIKIALTPTLTITGSTGATHTTITH